MTDTVSVQRSIAATPEALWDLVADLPSMGRWSPENQGGSWVGGATGPAVGAKFKGKNQNEGHSWKSISKIVVADRPSAVAWDVSFGPFKVARWSFAFASSGDGTDVTETWTDHRSKFFTWVAAKATGVNDRATHNEASMRATLDALAASAES